MKKVIITRKIQIYPIGDNSKEVWSTLREWEDLVFRAANYATTHMYFQDRQKEFNYLNGNYGKLAEANKEFKEMLECSEQNTTYRLLSEKLKGTVPSSIFSCLNSVIKQTFDKEKKEYFTGKRSLRSYRKGMPMPFSSKSIKNIVEAENNYEFTIFGFKFRTNFGRDLSGNKQIFERYLSGEYKLCDSSIQIKDKKMFLLAVFQFDQNKVLLSENVLFAELSHVTPIKCYESVKDEVSIGNVSEFLHQRLQIQGALHRLQKDLRYTKGGKGRKRKLQALERFELKEKNFVKTKIHQYSRMLIDECLKRQCGKLVLISWKDEDPKEHKLILRNWGYYGLKELISYKANMVGITVEEIEMERNKEEIEIQNKLLTEAIELI